MTTGMHRSYRVAAALVRSAVGDALGAPFEFGSPGRFSARLFPSPARGTRTEMCGGGPWEPARPPTTQMALLVAPSPRPMTFQQTNDGD